MTDAELYNETTELAVLILDVIKAWCTHHGVNPANQKVHTNIKTMLQQLVDTMPEPSEFGDDQVTEEPAKVDPSTLKN